MQHLLMRTVSKRCKGRTKIATDWRQQSTWTVGMSIQTAHADSADVQMINPQVWSVGGNQRTLRTASRFDDLALKALNHGRQCEIGCLSHRIGERRSSFHVHSN